MRRRSLLLATLLTALLFPAATAAPHAGLVAQGETRTHDFDNTPRDGSACIHLATTWTVTLAYAPPTDTLTLRAGGVTATGHDGVASVSFVSGVCTAFAIEVEGTRVENVAAYAVSVNSLVGGSVLAWDAA